MTSIKQCSFYARDLEKRDIKKVFKALKQPLLYPSVVKVTVADFEAGDDTVFFAYQTFSPCLRPS